MHWPHWVVCNETNMSLCFFKYTRESQTEGAQHPCKRSTEKIKKGKYQKKKIIIEIKL